MSALETAVVIALLALILGWLVGGWIGIMGAVVVLGYLAALEW